MGKIIIGVVCGVIGFFLGAAEENLRYSVIAHEADKGDQKCKQIMDEFPKVGQKIENILS